MIITEVPIRETVPNDNESDEVNQASDRGENNPFSDKSELQDYEHPLD